MDKHDCRTTIAEPEVLREEQLIVNLQSVGSLGHDEQRLDVSVGGKSGT
jgi:hypothetical protein